MAKRNVRVTLGMIDYDINFDQFLDMVEEARNRIEREKLIQPYINLEYERGYYDEIQMKVLFTAIRQETDEEEKIRETEEKQRLEAERRRLKSQLLKGNRRELYEELKREFEK